MECCVTVNVKETHDYERTFQGDDIFLTWVNRMLPVEMSCTQCVWHDYLGHADRCNKQPRPNQGFWSQVFAPSTLKLLISWKNTCALTKQYNQIINNLVSF